MNWKSVLLSVVCSAATPSVNGQIISEALRSFPAQTEIIEYDNLAALRNLPNYEALKQRFSGKPLQEAKAALNKLNIEDSDVDEVVLGSSSDGVEGLIGGSFSASLAAKTVLKKRILPLGTDDETKVICPGTETCLAFLEENVVAFGSLAQLRCMVQTRLGLAERLSSNADLAALLNRTEDRAIVRSVATGKQMKEVVSGALADLSGFTIDWSTLTSSVNLFAYAVNLDSKAHVSATLECKLATSTFMLKQLLSALASFGPTGLPFQNLRVSGSGNAIDLKMDTAL